jgi:hypothetical protein
VLLIQDVQVVMGREEIPFDDEYRDQLAPSVAEDPGTRLAGFFWAPHGGGEGYEAITLTAVADADALARHQVRLSTGDLAECWSGFEAKVRSLQSTLHRVADWSPFAAAGLGAFTVGEHATALYRLDSFTVARGVAAAAETIESQFRDAAQGTTVTIAGSWTPFLGDLEEPVVHVLSRVASDEALREAFSDPARTWGGTPEIEGARRVTRLLRSSPWSPLH